MTARVTDGIRRLCGLVNGMRDNEFEVAEVRKAAVAEECDRLDEAVVAMRQDMWDEGFEAGRERSIEDREAAACVREHGGLSHVREHWSGRVAQSHVHNMAERHKAKIARMQSHIESVQRKCRERQEHICELNKTIADMRPRLMPEDIVRDPERGDWVNLMDSGGARFSHAGFIFTHERAEIDSWERLEEDVANASCPDVYCSNHHIDASDTSYEWAMACDIVRRARALAERGQ